MYAEIEFKNNEVYILRCPKCNNALGINPFSINKCDKCNTNIEHTKEYVNDWLLYCNHVINNK